MGGMEIWRHSNKLGLAPPRNRARFPAFATFAKRLMATRPHSGDGQIEVFSMGTTADYAQAAMVKIAVHLCRSQAANYLAVTSF